MVVWLYGWLDGYMVGWFVVWLYGRMVGRLDAVATNEIMIPCKVAYGIRIYNDWQLGDTSSAGELLTEEFLLDLNIT